MIHFRKLIFIHFILFIAFTSCGTDHSRNERSLASVGQNFSSEVKPMSVYQAEIGLKVCQALRSKRLSWHTTPVIGRTAKFNIESNSCELEQETITIDTKITSSLMSDPMIFDSLETSFYFKEIMTEVHGPLKTICPLLLQGDGPLEFYATGNDRVYVRFYRESKEISTLTLHFAEPDSDEQQKLSGYKSYKTVTYDIVTSSQAPEILGSVKEINEVQSCGTKKGQSTFVQSLISIL